MTRAPLLSLSAALLLTLASAGAAEPTATPAPASASAPAAHTTAAPALQLQQGSSTATLTLYLVLLVALLGGGAWLARNGNMLFQPKPKGARKLQLSEMRMLGNRQFLVVAEYEDRKMLLGVCPGRIDYLATLASAEPDFPKIAPEKLDE